MPVSTWREFCGPFPTHLFPYYMSNENSSGSSYHWFLPRSPQTHQLLCVLLLTSPSFAFFRVLTVTQEATLSLHRGEVPGVSPYPHPTDLSYWSTGIVEWGIEDTRFSKRNTLKCDLCLVFLWNQLKLALSLDMAPLLGFSLISICPPTPMAVPLEAILNKSCAITYLV